jgi:glucose/arabinose dehydrogenase
MNHQIVAIALLAVLADCRERNVAATPPPQPTAGHESRIHESEKGRLRVTEVVIGLDHPWSVAFLPDGTMLVTERPGRLRHVLRDGRVSAPLRGLPPVFAEGQSGLLDVVLSPRFTEDRRIYLSYGEASLRGNKAGTAVARARLAEGEGALDDLEVIYRQEPKLSSGSHVGSRLAFADDGTLFVTQGENRQAERAQELDKLQGKLVRIRPDGSVPLDNPFVGRRGARPEIWSYGHRNMQGAAIHPRTRRLWTHEHGPRGGDEINLTEPGRNYGWPLITHGLDYTGTTVPGSIGNRAEGMESPHHVWQESPAISGMAFYTRGRVAAWEGNLFIGALATRELLRLELDPAAGDAVIHEERLLGERKERIRDVRLGPDGALYLLTDEEDGKLLRVEPAG